MARQPPGRLAAAGGALRALAVNVAGCAVLGAAAAAVGAVFTTGHPLMVGAGFALGALFGSYLGLLLGGAHAIVQAVVLLAVRQERRRPASPAAATAVSALALAGILTWLVNDAGTTFGEGVLVVVPALLYTGLTWPVADQLFPPARPTLRRPDSPDDRARLAS